MDKFLTLPETDREVAFQEAANRKSVAPIIIEKDFWVCWTLRELQEIPELGEFLTFKGGTSLSKAYHLIERFSEDIDLTIARDAQYFQDCSDPMEDGLSGKELGRRIDAIKIAAQKFVAEYALPKLQSHFEPKLKQFSLQLDEGDKDKQTILFSYPFIYGDGSWDGSSWDNQDWDAEGYIKPVIRIEFGARGEIEPNEQKTITPYLAEIFPNLFESPETNVSTLGVERTFWEKVTILHGLHHNFKGRDRMSRHYYDTYIMFKAGIAAKALSQPNLLTAVVRNKTIMFKDNANSYETAKFGSLKLIPSNERIAELRKDYEAMNEMFMGEIIPFEEIITGLKELEKLLNS